MYDRLEKEEAVLQVLLIHCQCNDSKRHFAGIRKPSRTHRKILQALADLYDERTKRNKAFLKAM